MFVALALDGGLSPAALTSFRLLLGTVLLFAVVFYRRLPFPLDLKSWLIFAVFGLFGSAFPFYLIAWGQQTVPSSTTGTLMAIMPLVTMFLAHYLVPNEQLNRYKVLGLLMAFVGVYVLLSPNIEGDASLIGQLSILAAASSYALNTVLVRVFPSFDPLVGSTGMLLWGFILTAPMLLLPIDHWPDSLNGVSMFAMLWLAVVPTGLASIIYFVVISRAGPSFLANSNFMVPIIAFLSGVILLSETITVSKVVALIVILMGIGLTRIRVRAS